MAEKLLHEHIPLGGLNHDDSDWIIPPQDYRFVINGRVTSEKEGQIGVVKNIKGTTQVSYNLPAGENEVVGEEMDLERNSIIYMLYNSNLNHAILRYNISDGVIQPILENEPLLEFDPQYPVAFIDIIKELMYWTQTNVAPKKINLVKARQFTLGTGGYSAITEQTLDAIQYPPLHPPTVRVDSDPNFNDNNIIGNMFQFSYSYKYEDNEKSAWSPYSSVLAPIVSNERQDGEVLFQFPFNNMAVVTLETGTDLVKDIIVAARKGNNRDWVVVETLNKSELGIPDNTIYEFEFRNNLQQAGVAQDIINRPHDFIPHTARAQEAVERSTLAYGGCEEGQDPVNIDVKLEVAMKDMDISLFQSTLTSDIITSDEDSIVGPLWYISFNVNSTPPIPGVVFRVSFYRGDGVNISITHTITPTDLINWPYDFMQWIADEITDQGGIGAVTDLEFIPGTQDNIIWIPILPESGRTIQSYIRIPPRFDLPNFKFPGFKMGSTHRFALVYFDRANRSGAANIDRVPNFGTEIYIPFYTEIDQSITQSTNRAEINWQIKHQPPIWATHYQWYYAGSRIGYFTQFVINEIGPDVSFDQRVFIDIEALNNHQTNYQNSNISAYTFTPGDRIRFITQANDPGNNIVIGPLTPAYVDMEILAQDPNDPNRILVNDFNYSAEGITSTGKSIVEIYTPLSRSDDDESLYYAMGEAFDIINPHTNDRAHQGVLQDQDANNLSTVPAEGTFIEGDVYHILRSFGLDILGNGINSTPWYVESRNYSDFYPSNSYSRGRSNIVDPDVKRAYLNIVRHGQRLFENTGINGLSTFYSNDYTDEFSDRYGTINSIIEVGYTLKVIQSLKNSSIYIGRTVTTDGGQGQVTLKSDNLFGTVIPAEDDFGTVDPLSVEKYHRYLYFYDRTNGLYIRDAANGMFPISRYKMTKFFKEISEDVVNGVISNLRVISRFDQKHERLMVTFGYEATVVVNYTGTTGTGPYTETLEIVDYSLDFELYQGLEITIKPNGEDEITGTILTNSNQVLTVQTTTPLTEFFSQGNAKGIKLCYERGDTLSYKEGENRWKEFYTYNPEMYSRFGDLFVSFLKGELSIHDDNEKHNTFYGIEYPLVETIVINTMGKKSKVYNSLTIYANRDGWRATNIRIEPSDENVTGMRSRIEIFKAKEEGYHASFLKDELTPNAPSQEYALVNGRELRGPVATLTVQNQTINELIVRRILAKLTSSEQTT